MDEKMLKILCECLRHEGIVAGHNEEGYYAEVPHGEDGDWVRYEISAYGLKNRPLTEELPFLNERQTNFIWEIVYIFFPRCRP